MELEEILPQDFGSFKLAATGDKVHRLRKLSLLDHTWVKEQTGYTLLELGDLGKEDHLKMWDITARIVYHLLLDQTPFAQIEVKRLNEMGLECIETIGGTKRLLACISGQEEPILVAKAFGKAMSASDPLPVQKKTENPQPLTTS